MKRLAEQAAYIATLEPSSRRSPTPSCAPRRPSSGRGSENGEELDDLLFEAYAAVREARVRESDQRMFDVQMMGGIVLHEGDVAEMKTGEGKTFVASLALYLNALPTVSDARRAHARPGRPPRHGQRLPRPARRRVEPRRLRAARHDRLLHRHRPGAAREEGAPTRPTSPTARTRSSASTTSATTWRSRSTTPPSAATPTRSSTRSTRS